MTSIRVRPVSSAFHSAHAAARPRNVRNASGLLLRNIAVAIGVAAKAMAARWAAVLPRQRRTRWWTMRTDPTPASASGRSIENDEKPRTLANSAWTQSAAGGLSTVMKLPGSMAPKKNAFHDTVALFTAAA
jgi:hypothetical protein